MLTELSNADLEYATVVRERVVKLLAAVDATIADGWKVIGAHFDVENRPTIQIGELQAMAFFQPVHRTQVPRRSAAGGTGDGGKRVSRG